MIITIRSKNTLRLFWGNRKTYPEKVTADHRLWWDWLKREYYD